MTTDIKAPVTDTTKTKMVLVQLNQEEADIYFSSDWYKEQIKRARHRLIDGGFIKNVGYHENNPAHLQVPKPVTFESKPAAIIIRPKQDQE